MLMGVFSYLWYQNIVNQTDVTVSDMMDMVSLEPLLPQLSPATPTRSALPAGTATLPTVHAGH